MSKMAMEAAGSVVCYRMVGRKPRARDVYGFANGDGIVVFEADLGRVHLLPPPTLPLRRLATVTACFVSSLVRSRRLVYFLEVKWYGSHSAGLKHCYWGSSEGFAGWEDSASIWIGSLKEPAAASEEVLCSAVASLRQWCRGDCDLGDADTIRSPQSLFLS